MQLLVLYPFNDTQRDNDKMTRHAMPEKYNIVLSGRHPAADPHQVALKLAALFKCTAEQAGHLLSQPSCVVKKVVAADVADKYKKGIEWEARQPKEGVY